jgi:hypothetical protein
MINNQEFSEAINTLRVLVDKNRKQENEYLVRVKDLKLNDLSALFLDESQSEKLRNGKSEEKTNAINSFLSNYILMYNNLSILEVEKFIYKNKLDDSIILPVIHSLATDSILIEAVYPLRPKNERSILERILGDNKYVKTQNPKWEIYHASEEIYVPLELRYYAYVIPLYANDPIYKTINDYVTHQKEEENL